MKKYFLVIALFLVLVSGTIYKKYYYREIVLCAVGDILLDRGVGAQVNGEYDYPYRKVKNILERADITLGNLEGPITIEGTPALKRPSLIFKADPENVAAIKSAGFDILNLANNHTMDYGTEGIISTMNILNDHNIDFFGAGQFYEEARKPVYINKNGYKIGFLGYSVFPPEGYITFNDRPDVAKVDVESLADEVRSAKENCDFLVVSFHWGKEYDFYAGKMQKMLAHTAIDSGSNVVIGHHPHVLQGIERYRDGLIVYSLGNFIFDRQIQSGTDETMIVNLKIKNKSLDEVEIIPVKIDDCQPNIANGSQAKYILNRLKIYSEGMNTDIVIKNDKGYVFWENDIKLDNN